MVHYTRWQNPADPLAEAREVARAARDVGVRVGFAIAMADRNQIAYADNETVLARLPEDLRGPVRERLCRPPRTPRAFLDLADAIAAACGGPDFNVQYGPHALPWCSPELMQAVAQASADTGRQVHLHLLETRYQREWADHAFKDYRGAGGKTGAVGWLRDIGLLSPRLTVAHCCWCRPEELEILAEAGVTISVNTGSNLTIRSGIAPVAGMLAAGCRVAMGLDGLSVGEDDDALRELRLLHQLHKGWGYETPLTGARVWEIAARHGRYTVSGMDAPYGLAPGAPADILVLDGARLMPDRVFEDAPVYDAVLARAHAGHIERVIVGGRTIAKDGALTGVDFPALTAELLAQLRARLDEDAGSVRAWRAAVKRLDAALKPFYLDGGHMGCC
ncbi:MAG: amidohydrolase family protein [Candidatus Protistobacter heckmanni]|nr:amidohydrolase family protein [Candidatus Protistobacter heckmanni]